MYDLHADIVLGRNHTFEIWAKSEMEKGLVEGNCGASSRTQLIAENVRQHRGKLTPAQQAHPRTGQQYLHCHKIWACETFTSGELRFLF